MPLDGQEQAPGESQQLQENPGMLSWIEQAMNGMAMLIVDLERMRGVFAQFISVAFRETMNSNRQY